MEVKAGDGAELDEGPSGIHTQTERRGFAGAFEGRKFFNCFDSAFAAFESFAVELGVGPVFGARAVEVSGGAGADTVVRAAAPVVDVVTAGPRRDVVAGGGTVAREIGDFVLDEPGAGGAFDEFFVHGAGEVFVDADFSGGELREERGVVLVDHFVAGEVFAAESDGFVERLFPHGHGLTGDGEHEVEVDVVESRAAEDVEGFENHVAAVNAAKAVEEIFIKGLDAHGDAVDAEVAPEFCLVEGDGGRVAFDGPFRSAEEVEAPHGFEDASPLFQVENGGRAAAEEDGVGPEIVGDEFKFANEGVSVTLDQFAAAGLGVEGAIGTFLRAERDMHVEAGNRFVGPRRHRR